MENHLRSQPRAVVDVTTRGGVNPFKKIPSSVVLRDGGFRFSYASRIYAGLAAKGAVVAVVLVGMLSGFAIAPMVYQPSLASAQNSADERQALEEELKGVELEISQYQDTIDSLQTQSRTLKSEIKQLDSRVKQTNLRIKATDLSLQKVGREIEATQDQISTTEGEIQFNRDALRTALRAIYQEEDISLVELLLRNPNFSDFFGEINSLFSMQNTTRQTIERVTELKNRLLDQQETLSLERADVAALKEFNEAQKEVLSQTKVQKDTILQQTKGQESRYQDLLKKSVQTAAELRSRIFAILGGGELTFDEAVKLARMAERATGVRAAMLLAILDRESSLGKNVGRCPYYDKEKNRYYMHPTRDVPIFLTITRELNLDPNNVMVSCPNKDGTYGGAMGPSQFIPSTWACYAGYVNTTTGKCGKDSNGTTWNGPWVYDASRDRIGNSTGHNPPSPWNNADAFLATAVYLKELGADAQTTSAERTAAAKYYAGSRWRTFLWTYGDWVANRANAYQKDIAILEN
jgi:peptidoglycan hydrolase CwlO-like protein